MSGHHGAGTRLDASAGLTSISRDHTPSVPALAVQRQRQPRPSLRASLLGGASTTAAPTPTRPSRLRVSVATLVRRLSRQNLQSPSPPPDRTPPAVSPRSSSSTPKIPDHPPKLAPTLDFSRDDWSADTAFGHLHSPGSVQSRTAFSAPVTPIATTPADGRLSQCVPDALTFRPSGIYLTNGVDDPMDIQQDEPTQNLTPASAIIHYPEPIEPLPPPSINVTAADTVLEVDEAYCSGDPSSTYEDTLLEEERAMINRARGLRRPSPGGTMQRHAHGMPLRYRLSADAALRCQNLVRAKPRMRRRRKQATRELESQRTQKSSAVSSSASSIVSVVMQEPLPQQHNALDNTQPR